ncbi:hypothetical protein BJV77DRAFT_969037 [Russula vinacea]|nr:hypothetical protein BJV77DRAFT_969037 [Russula vinacea]
MGASKAGAPPPKAVINVATLSKHAFGEPSYTSITPSARSFIPRPAPRAGYQYVRPIAPSYSGFSSIMPPGLVASEPSTKYECPYCGKCFTRSSVLKIHVHSHTGERPYGCTFEGCNRSFSVESNLRRHARTHLQSVNEDRESEGEEESEEALPAARSSETQIPQPRR